MCRYLSFDTGKVHSIGIELMYICIIANLFFFRNFLQLGIIQEQTIKGSVYSYIGVALGFINLALLSPLIFTTDQIGLTQVMLATVAMLAQLSSLGFIDVGNRLFPYFRNKTTKNDGFLGLTLLVNLTGYIIVTALLLILLPGFVEKNLEKSALMSEYAYYIPVLLGLFLFFNVFDNHIKVLFNAVLGTFLKEVFIRIGNLVLILAFHFGLIDFNSYILWFVINQAVPSIIVMVIYLYSQGELRPGNFRKHITPEMYRQIVSIAVFGMLAGFSGVAISSIDKYLVNKYVGLSQAGVYSIAFYFATIIVIPGRSLGKIAVTVVAEAWKKNDLKTITDIYRKSSVTQFAIAILLFIGIVANLSNIFRILPPEYANGEAVIVIVSLANLIAMSTGVNQFILGTSEHYRHQTYLMILLIVLIFASNIILIPLYGITGAAIANLISMTISSLLRVWILYRKTGLNPYYNAHIKILIISGIAFASSLVIPQLSLITDIIVRSSVVGLIFVVLFLVSKISDETNALFVRITKAIGNIIKRTND